MFPATRILPARPAAPVAVACRNHLDPNHTLPPILCLSVPLRHIDRRPRRHCTCKAVPTFHSCTLAANPMGWRLAGVTAGHGTCWRRARAAAAGGAGSQPPPGLERTATAPLQCSAAAGRGTQVQRWSGAGSAAAAAARSSSGDCRQQQISTQVCLSQLCSTAIVVAVLSGRGRCRPALRRAAPRQATPPAGAAGPGWQKTQTSALQARGSELKCMRQMCAQGRSFPLPGEGQHPTSSRKAAHPRLLLAHLRAAV